MTDLRDFALLVAAGAVGFSVVTLAASRVAAASAEEKLMSDRRPSPEELKTKLTPEQFEVVCNGPEPDGAPLLHQLGLASVHPGG